MTINRLGCIADDFTGASDVASFLTQVGVNTLLLNGQKLENIDVSAFDAIVIALKTRTISKEQAIQESLDAYEWLKKVGIDQLYIKYCSTFDSTKDGNIGPICDTFIELFDIPYTVLCPSLIENGRTVKEGHLYVNGVPLHQTSMRYHPLTPMLDSDLRILMQSQSKYPTFMLTSEVLEQGGNKLADILNSLTEKHEHFYLVPDFECKDHGLLIANQFGHLPFLTGASGLIPELGRLRTKNQKINDEKLEHIIGPTAIIAGSCSVTTLAQIEDYQDRGNFAVSIDPIQLIEVPTNLVNLYQEIDMHKEKDILIYSSQSIDVRELDHKYNKECISSFLEKTMGEVAKYLYSKGYRKFVIAGGETSGAVALALDFEAYRIGESVSPGVPIMSPINCPDVRVVYKSGNFGQADFFTRAILMLGENHE